MVSHSSSWLIAKTKWVLVTYEKEKGRRLQNPRLPPIQQTIPSHAWRRRTTSLAYTDADDDAERLLSFTDASAPSADDDEWVETHAGRQAHKADSATNAGEIADIPDLDGDGPHEDEERIAQGLGRVSLGGGGGGGEGVGTTETPDLDDIPDMEEDDLEDGDDEATAAAPKVSVIPAARVVDDRYVIVGFAGN